MHHVGRGEWCGSFSQRPWWNFGAHLKCDPTVLNCCYMSRVVVVPGDVNFLCRFPYRAKFYPPSPSWKYSSRGGGYKKRGGSSWPDRKLPPPFAREGASQKKLASETYRAKGGVARNSIANHAIVGHWGGGPQASEYASPPPSPEACLMGRHGGRGWFPKEWFWQIFTCTEISSKMSLPCNATLAEERYDFWFFWDPRTETLAHLPTKPPITPPPLYESCQKGLHARIRKRQKGDNDGICLHLWEL